MKNEKKGMKKVASPKIQKVEKQNNQPNEKRYYIRKPRENIRGLK